MRNACFVIGVVICFLFTVNCHSQDMAVRKMIEASSAIAHVKVDTVTWYWTGAAVDEYFVTAKVIDIYQGQLKDTVTYFVFPLRQYWREGKDKPFFKEDLASVGLVKGKEFILFFGKRNTNKYGYYHYQLVDRYAGMWIYSELLDSYLRELIQTNYLRKPNTKF